MSFLSPEQRPEPAHVDEDEHRGPPVKAERSVRHVDALGGVVVEPLAPHTPEQADAIAQRLAALILRNLKR